MDTRRKLKMRTKKHPAIGNPATLHELYDWCMANDIDDTRLMTPDAVAALKELRSALDWEPWQTDHPQPRLGSIMAIVMLFERAKGEATDDAVGALTHTVLEMFVAPLALLDTITVDFERQRYTTTKGYSFATQETSEGKTITITKDKA